VALGHRHGDLERDGVTAGRASLWSAKMRPGIALVVVAMLVVVACETVPITGRSQVVLFSEQQVSQLADQHHAQFMNEARAKNLLVTGADPAMAQTLTVVDRVGRRIVDAAGLADRYRWEIALVKQNQANAFVRPNGKIVVYTGILPATKSEAGLAAVLGHEVGHVTARHSAERLTHGMLAQAGVGAANAAVAAYDPRYAPVTAAVLGFGVQYGALMPYNRAHESEADHLGILYMAKAGYDPAEAIALWERMEAGGGGARQPEWMSTHPSPATRRAQLREWLADAQRYYRDPTLPLPR
jgi:predicted Zn-dependent protease